MPGNAGLYPLIAGAGFQPQHLYWAQMLTTPTTPIAAAGITRATQANYALEHLEAPPFGGLAVWGPAG